MKPLLLLPFAGLSLVSSDLPPERYRGMATAVVVVGGDDTIAELCGPPPRPGSVVLACRVRTGDGTSLVVLPPPCPHAAAGEYWARPACHEFGHVQGWSRWHEP